MFKKVEGDIIIYYVDGSCRGNGNENSQGGYGVVGIQNDKITFAYSKQSNNTTNNREELKAILYVMLTKGNVNENFDKPPIVYSDSNYCVQTLNNWMFNWANNNWIKSDKKIPENLDLIQTYYEYFQKGFRIDLRKIKGHNGIFGNEIADKLATNSITPEEIINKIKGEI